MFERIRQRVGDVKTIAQLCQGAERQAQQDGQAEPGAEHFLLAALDLPDGTARRVFERLGADAGDVRAAVHRQYADALSRIGVDAASFEAIDDASSPLPPGGGLYKAAPSGEAVMQALSRREGAQGRGPLLGAHVVAAVAALKQGVAARTLRAMGLEPEAVARAALQEVQDAGGSE